MHLFIFDIYWSAADRKITFQLSLGAIYKRQLNVSVTKRF